MATSCRRFTASRNNTKFTLPVDSIAQVKMFSAIEHAVIARRESGGRPSAERRTYGLFRLDNVRDLSEHLFVFFKLGSFQ